MKKNLTFLFIILTTLTSFAHHGNVLGKVYDKESNLAIQGVHIQILGLGRSTITNELGQYHFDNLPQNTYQLKLTFVGFETQEIIITVKDDENTILSTYLKATSLELDEVTVSAEKPQEQSLISSLDIKLRPINNSQEVLRMVPGLFIGQHAGGGKAEQIFLRGFDLDHGTDIKLSVDGMPVNMVSHAHGQGYADLHFVIPELIQKVDFKKGMYNAEKGNFSTAGWVDFSTRNALEHSFIKVETGQYDTYRAVAGIDLLGEKGKNNNQSAYIASEYSFTNSYFDNPQNFKRLNIVGKYHGHLGKNTNLTVTGSTFWSKWNHSGQIPDRAVASGVTGFFGSIDPSEGGVTSRSNFNLQLVTSTPKNNLIKSQFFYSNYNFELYSNFTFFKEDRINGDQIRQKENRNLFGYNGSFMTQSNLGKTQFTTIVGVQYRQDLTKNTELSHTKVRTILLNPIKLGNINELNAGVYLDEDIRFSDHFSINTGVRLDYFNNQYQDFLTSPDGIQHSSATILSPKLNFYYTANPSFQVYLNSGKSFHSNDTRVVVTKKGIETLPAAYGSDLGVNFKPFPKLLINAALWYLWLDQEFVYVGDAGVVEPSGRTRRYGLDLSLRYQLTKNLYADVDISSAKPRSVDNLVGQNYLPLAPTFTSTGGLSLQTGKGFSGSLRYRYMGDRPANEDNSIVAKGYFVNDLQVNYAKHNWNIGLSIQNLFNTRWKETQFATESQLKKEVLPVEEIHFTPGTPFLGKLSFMVSF